MPKTIKINPDRWYILDLRDPKNPRVPATKFLFLELVQAAITKNFPNTALVMPIRGQELIEWDISPRFGAYKKFRFSVKAYDLPDGLTHRQKVTIRKRYRRQTRRARLKAFLEVPQEERYSWYKLIKPDPTLNSHQKRQLFYTFCRKFDHL